MFIFPIFIHTIKGGYNDTKRTFNESICNTTTKKIINFLNNELSTHEKLYNSLLKHMEGIANE